MEAIEKHAREIMREQTLVLVKPDGVMRGLTCQILQRFEQVGFKIVGLKILLATRSQLDNHFPRSEEWILGMGQKTLDTCVEYDIDPIEILNTRDPREIGEIIREWNYLYLMAGPVVAVVLEGVHAIDVVRKLVGHTLPYRADPGTIRGDFSINSPDLANVVGSACKNLVHASANIEEAEQEIRCWFSQEELISWERTDEFLMFMLGENVRNTEQKEANHD